VDRSWEYINRSHCSQIHECEKLRLRPRSFFSGSTVHKSNFSWQCVHLISVHIKHKYDFSCTFDHMSIMAFILFFVKLNVGIQRCRTYFFLHSPFNFQRKWSKWRVLTPSPPPRRLPDRILCQLFDWHQFSLTKVKLACEIVPDSRRNPAQQILLCRCTVQYVASAHNPCCHQHMTPADPAPSS
jgi:hypothetical protein